MMMMMLILYICIINYFCIINNLLDVIDVIGKPTFLVKNISTWNISTLYTSIPHDKFKIRNYELLEIFTTVNKIPNST